MFSDFLMNGLLFSDHAGWRLQGPKGAGCQETHPEDDGGEGTLVEINYLIPIYLLRFCLFSATMFTMWCWMLLLVLSLTCMMCLIRFFIMCLCFLIGISTNVPRAKLWSTWSQRSRWCHALQTSVWWHYATSGEYGAWKYSLIYGSFSCCVFSLIAMAWCSVWIQGYLTA